jgi:hypothetical protein
MVRVDLLPGRTPGSGERVDQRTSVLHPVVLVKRMDDGAGVPPGRRRISLSWMRLPRDRVDRSRCRASRTAPPERLAGAAQPERVVACLSPRGPVPGHGHRLQEPQPAEEFVSVGPHRRRRAVRRHQVPQELRHRRHLRARRVRYPVRHQSAPDLLHPADPRHHQRIDIPPVLRHRTNLPGPSRLPMTRDSSTKPNQAGTARNRRAAWLPVTARDNPEERRKNPDLG